MARTMLRSIPTEEKDHVPGVGTLNLEAILAEVKKDLEAARAKIQELEHSLAALREEMEPLRQAEKEEESLRRRLTKLKSRLQTQEADLTAQIQAQLSEAEQKDKEVLVQDMNDDYMAIMKSSWAALLPNSNFEKWDKQFATCSDAYNAEILGQIDDEEAAEEEEESSDSSSESEQEGEAAGEPR
ncbi:protein FAM9A-like [Chenopodium quinoa]|uniref:protein FAM9A-like n=1 Tax=Chenopodium quinoa TaxID=63459 RepID=UPI000B798B4B|nr:protein FAM9A-like [Chenopodium quinoa]